MRQVLDEADRVGDEHARPGHRLQGTDGGVQRGEQLVLHQHLAAGERPHQGGFSRIGVADQRDPKLVTAGGAALVAVALHRVQLLLQLGKPVADLAAIEVQGAFTSARALLPAAAGRGLPHAGRHIFQARHLHLKLRLASVGMAVEDLDDDAGSVEHLGAGGALEVADLAGREIMVDDDEFGLAACASGSGSAGSARSAAPSNRCRAFDFGGGAIEPTTPVPPVSAASSASFPLPSSAAAPVPSRFCDSVPTTS